MNNLEEMDKFLETHNLPRLNHEEIENQHKPSWVRELNQQSKIYQQRKTKDQMLFLASQPNIKEELMPILVKLFQKIEEEGPLSNSFYEATITLIPKPDKDTTRKENYRPVSLMSIDAKILNKMLTN